MRRAVFLDRDGVLLDHGGMVVASARKALDRLCSEGWATIVVTNQPDIANGKMLEKTAARVHAALEKVLAIDETYMCPHKDTDFCDCRKPKPGMLLVAAKAHDIDLPQSYMVGDRWRDVSAGKAAGCKTILIGTGYGETFVDEPDHRVADIEQAVNIILGAI